MVKLNRAQRVALKRVFDQRIAYGTYRGWRRYKLIEDVGEGVVSIDVQARTLRIDNAGVVRENT